MTTVRWSSDLLALAVVAISTLAVPRPSEADWPPFGRAIVTRPESQVHSVVATDGAGGAIIAWQDFRFPRVNIFAHHVLATGNLDAAWPSDGRALLTDPAAMTTADGGQTSPAIVSDGAGGAIVAWQDNRSPVTETDIFAQHILASGVVDPAWPANGLAVSARTGLQNTFVMVSDGAGGAIVAWQDTQPGVDQVDLFAMHVLASGSLDARWPVDGLAVVTAQGRQELPAMVSDGAGGALVAWQDHRGANDDVYAQRLLNSGVVDPAWPVNGRVVCSAGGDQGGPTITSDGGTPAAGAIVSWTDGRVVDAFHIFAQHVRVSGTIDPAWPDNGRAISNVGTLETRPLAVPDGAGGAIVTWQAVNVHLNMFAQHVTANGLVDPAWPSGGRALSVTSRQQSHADVVSDGAGGAVVAWEDTFDVVAQHVLASGALDSAYPDTGRVLVGLPSSQGDVAITATGGGGAIVAWTDGRDGNANIYALQVLEAGTVDVPTPEPPAITFLPASPNPARGSLALRFTLPREARVTLSIYDATGRRMRELSSGVIPPGEHRITWDLNDRSGRLVPAGVFFARLEVEGRALTQTIATLK